MTEKIIKPKFDNMKQRVSYYWGRFCDWCCRHKDVLIVIVPAAISGIVGISNVVAKQSRHKDEKRLKDRMVYDRQLGAYLETRRKLRNDELVYINRRHKEGETIADILDDMRLLK